MAHIGVDIAYPIIYVWSIEFRN